MNVPAFFPGPAPQQRDTTNAEAARRLCKIIEQKWRSCGHFNVECWVEPHPIAGAVIRSNLVRGLPPL